VSKGSIPGVSLALPESSEVRSVEVLAESMSKGPHLKSWQQVHDAKGNRSLEIAFQAPLAREVQVRLGLVPRLSVRPGNVQLSLPLPLRTADIHEGLLAYRLEGLDGRDSPQGLATVGVKPDVFAKAWRGADPRAAVAPTRAFSFRRNAARAALALALTAPRPQGTQEIVWQVHSAVADVTAKWSLTAAAADLMLLEIQAPPALVLTGVTGPHLHHWSRRDGVIQVWLTEPQKETALTLTGWLKNAQPAAGAKAGRFDLPPIQLHSPAILAGTIQVRAAAALSVEPQKLQNLTRAPTREGPIFAVQKTPLPYAGVFRLLALPVQPEARIVTVAKIQNQGILVVSHVDVQVPFGGLKRLTVDVRNWPGNDVKLDVPAVVAKVEHRRNQAGHTWILTLLPGTIRQLSCKLAGRLSLEGRRIMGTGRATDPGGLSMPDVRVNGATMERWLAVAGPSLQAGAVRGLTAIKDSAGLLPRWPDAAARSARDSTVWHIDQEDWRLELLPRAAAPAPAVQVLLAEHHAAIGANHRWLHEIRFLLFAKGGTDLHLTLPSGARLLAASLDETPVTPRQPAPEHVWLPLTGATGPRLLRLCWTYDADDLDRPRLASPIIQGVAEVPILGVVRVPPGYEARSPLTAADLYLARARAQLQLSSLIGERDRRVEGGAARAERSAPGLTSSSLADLAKAQQQFVWACRQADYVAARSARAEELLAAVKTLRQQNSRLLRSLDLEKSLRLDQQSSGSADSHLAVQLPDNGMPIYWRQDGPAAPALELTPRAREQTRTARFASEVLLLIGVGLVLLSYLPRTSAVIKAFWPEQLLLGACLGIYFWDLSLFAIVLVAVAIAARFILAVLWLQRLWHRPAAPASGSSLQPT
jgi:hypothetical protein